MRCSQYVDYSTWPQILDFCFQGSFMTFYFTFIFELEKLWWINDFFKRWAINRILKGWMKMKISLPPLYYSKFDFPLPPFFLWFGVAFTPQAQICSKAPPTDHCLHKISQPFTNHNAPASAAAPCLPRKPPHVGLRGEDPHFPACAKPIADTHKTDSHKHTCTHANIRPHR